MLNKKPEVGDTVVIRGVVLRVSNNMFELAGSNGTNPFPWLCNERITEVIPKPWKPKVGDTVFTRSHSCSRGVEIQAICGDHILLWWHDHSGTPWVQHFSAVYKDKEFTICAV